MSENCKCYCNSTQKQGEYVCCNCGTHIELEKLSTLPPCPTCGNNSFIESNSKNYFEE